MGRLGNQMFQYAALRGIASCKGYGYSIPSHDMMLTKCFKIPSTKDNNNANLYHLDGIEYHTRANWFNKDKFRKRWEKSKRVLRKLAKR